MFDPKQFDELAHKLFTSLPVSLQNFEKEIQQKFKEILQATFSRLDLVTHQEFDVQTKVLARTREKVDELQARLEKFLALQQKSKIK